jgi:hypothetical protein
VLKGKGFYLWRLEECMSGLAEAIAAEAADAGLGHALVKLGDGPSAFGDLSRNLDVIAALKLQGIEVWGWHFVYGSDPEAEAAQIVQQASGSGVAGYVINAEDAWAYRFEEAARLMARVTSGLGGLPLGLSSFRYPAAHPEFPWKPFLESCSCNLPQVYWEQSHDPAAQLAKSIAQFSSLGFPSVGAGQTIPTGPAYEENDWSPTDADTRKFIAAVYATGAPAVTFFDWASAHQTGLWSTVAKAPWGRRARRAPPADNIDIDWPDADRATEYRDRVARVISRVDAAHPSEYRDTVVRFLVRLAWHEGSRLTTRVQGGDGPARSFLQIEAERARDGCEWADHLGSQDFANLVDSSGGVAADLLRAAYLALPATSDFPDQNLIGNLLTTRDVFGIYVARYALKRLSNPIPSGIDAQAAYWYENWKKSGGDPASLKARFAAEAREVDSYIG